MHTVISNFHGERRFPGIRVPPSFFPHLGMCYVSVMVPLGMRVFFLNHSKIKMSPRSSGVSAWCPN
jgi:hypothetical protein